MKRILITGANRGIGLELVRQGAARGDRIWAGCRSPEKAASLEKIAAQYPGQITLLSLDVTDEESIARAAAQVAGQTEGLDLLINNAAINLGDEKLSELRAKNLLEVLNVNAVGPVLVAQKFVRLLKKGNDPKIVNISSESGSIANMKHFRGYAYYGSKAAENMYTRALAVDPDTAGITVIAIHPGWVRTDMGGPDALLSSAESVAGILQVVDGLSADDNSKFYTWEGVEFPW